MATHLRPVEGGVCSVKRRQTERLHRPFLTPPLHQGVPLVDEAFHPVEGDEVDPDLVVAT